MIIQCCLSFRIFTSTWHGSDLHMSLVNVSASLISMLNGRFGTAIAYISFAVTTSGPWKYHICFNLRFGGPQAFWIRLNHGLEPSQLQVISQILPGGVCQLIPPIDLRLRTDSARTQAAHSHIRDLSPSCTHSVEKSRVLPHH